MILPVSLDLKSLGWGWGGGVQNGQDQCYAYSWFGSQLNPKLRIPNLLWWAANKASWHLHQREALCLLYWIVNNSSLCSKVWGNTIYTFHGYLLYTHCCKDRKIVWNKRVVSALLAQHEETEETQEELSPNTVCIFYACIVAYSILSCNWLFTLSSYCQWQSFLYWFWILSI